MITTASLQEYSSKELAQLAKEKGIPGWHSLRKAELIKALMKQSRQTTKRSKSSTSKSTSSRKTSTATKSKTSRTTTVRSTRVQKAAKSTQSSSASRRASTARPSNGKTSTRSVRATAKSNGRTSAATAKRKTTQRATAPKRPAPKTSPVAKRRIQDAQENRERLRDLTTAQRNGQSVPTKDRIILIVRDSFWLQAHWELTRATIERAQVALAEQWHTAKPVIRLLEIEDESTTNTSERVVRDIDIHGEVSNWYIDVPEPDRAYRVAIGYKTANDKFHIVCRSNMVHSPAPGGSDSIDENWTDIAENCEKIFAQSGGFDSDNSDGELKEMFEERLRRPMGSPIVTRFGVGADGILNRKRDFQFEVDAEMIIYGSTQPSAYVTLAGEPVRLRPDGTFTVRLSMPDRRQVLPVVASSADGVEQHTTVLAVERNTKVMEPFIKESSD